VPPIDLLIPELFASEGGIQIYSRTLIRALRRIRPEQPLRVFIRNDHRRHLPPDPTPGIAWHACRGSSLCLAATLLNAARCARPRLLLSTHPNFAPLQWLHHRLTGAPSWCSAHGIDVWTLQPGPRRWALARLQQLLPVSRFTADSLRQQLGVRCPELALLPNCFDPQRFSPGPRPAHLLRRYHLQPQQPLILTLSRLSVHDRYKHIDALIDAMPALLRQWPDLRLLIAGSGDLRPSLEQQARQLGLEGSVLFSGRLDDQELADHYRLASLFALPSEKEGFGIVFLEALGCGLPVLAGNRDGSVDPLADGRFGLLVDPRQPLAPPLSALLAGQGQDLWFQPQQLSGAVAEQFGFDAYCQRLDHLLAALPAAAQALP